MSRQDYDSKIETIQVIYLQEAENQFTWAQEDKDALTGAGLNWSFVEELPVRAGSLREAESIWFKERYGREQAQRDWNEKEPEAYELRDNLLHSMRYAFRNHNDLL